MDLIVFGFNDWHEWAGNGFHTRSAITSLKLSSHPDVERMLVVSAPSSIGINAVRSLRSVRGRSPRPGTTLRPTAVQRVATNVWAMDHSRLLPREDSYPSAYRVNGAVHDQLLRRRIKSTAADLGMRDPVLWIANPLMAKHLGLLGERLSVFDAIDDWSVHPQKRRMNRPILEGYEVVRRRADVVFAVSRDLCDRLGSGRDDVHWIPNGVEVERFECDVKVSHEPANMRSPRIGYVGTLQERLDVDMLFALVRRMPDASILLAGPLVAPQHFEELQGRPNVHFLGRQPSELVPNLIESFDVCILPHADNAFTRSMDPMKLYEYLAAGKPVVASGPVGGVPVDLLYHATDPEGFASAVERAVQEEDAGLVARRREFARSRSWDRVVAEMVGIVREKLAATAESATAG